MKTLTTTLHAIDNCGSCLQAYALQQYIVSLGHENEIIDYRPPYARNNGKPLKNFIKQIVFGKQMKAHWEVFDNFVKEYLTLTEKTYTSVKEIRKANLQADVFVTGSDQVWNDYFPCGNDPVYYLDFTTGKKISYAASVGQSPISQDSLEILCDKIKDFSAISVREPGTPAELKALDIDATWVCDPTLLHKKETYEKIMVSKETEEYLLVYLTEKSELLDAVIQKYREETDGKVIYVGSFLNRCDCDVNLTDVGPREFVGLIANASKVIAGSYHALLFSCIFGKEFVILPYKNNARMEQFLDYVECKKRYISDMKMYEDMGPIDWNNVHEKVEVLTNKSKDWLRRNLE